MDQSSLPTDIESRFYRSKPAPFSQLALLLSFLLSGSFFHRSDQPFTNVNFLCYSTEAVTNPLVKGPRGAPIAPLQWRSPSPQRKERQAVLSIDQQGFLKAGFNNYHERIAYKSLGRPSIGKGRGLSTQSHQGSSKTTGRVVRLKSQRKSAFFDSATVLSFRKDRTSTCLTTSL